MIVFISGVPGSGKTYYAVTIMKNDKNVIHTNIDIKKDIQVIPFVWADYYKKISRIFKYKENSLKAIKLAKRFNIYGISIYYDECHLELQKQNKIVIWWLSWHRHISQTIYLITQSKGTLAQIYRAYPEIFVEAHPATKRIFGSVMRYTEFASYRMSKDDVIRKFQLKARQDIFEIYRTGAIIKGASSLRNRLYFWVLFGFAPIIGFYLLINSFKHDDNNSNDKFNSVKTNTLSSIDNNITQVVLDNNNSFNVFCSSKIGCKYGVLDYSLKDFRLFILPKHNYFKEEVTAIIRNGKDIERITRFTLLDN